MPDAPTVQSSPLFLVPIAGPTIEPLSLTARPDRTDGLTLGRHESCDLKMPPTAESVSRYHLRFRFDGETRRWRVVDLGSRWGSFLNGVKLSPQSELPLGEGDLLRINPWTFAIGSTPRRRGLLTADDTGQTMVRTVGGAAHHAIQEDMLALLLESAAAIHDAPGEAELAERLIDAAVRGSGLPNAAVLRPVDTNGRFEILVSRLSTNRPGGAAESSGAAFTFSRSLLNAAADGHVAEITTNDAAGDFSQSILQMNITAALCVPLMLGPAPAAFLYLDARGHRSALAFSPMRPNAAAFCGALGRLAGLALANLKRVDVERRQAMIEHDLNAAAAAQRWVLPPRETKIGAFSITGESRPGRYVGGDFFDVIELRDGRIAVALGDVSGKGIEASVLMTATQGFLHAALQEHGEPGKAVTAANRFVCPRRPESRFVTLWVAVLDRSAATLSYVDAGHSYAALIDDGNVFTELSNGGGPPLGVVDDYVYIGETVALPARGRLVIVSDGVVEQPAPPAGHPDRNEFKMSGVRECVTRAIITDDIAELFIALVSHAGSNQLADDATAVCVKW